MRAVFSFLVLLCLSQPLLVFASSSLYYLDTKSSKLISVKNLKEDSFESEISSISIPKDPKQILSSHCNKRFYISHPSESCISVIDSESNKVLNKIHLPTDFVQTPLMLLSSDSKTLYLTSIFWSKLFVINTHSLTLQEYDLPNSGGPMVLSQTNDKLFIASFGDMPGIFTVCTKTFNIKTTEIFEGTFSLVLSGDDKKLFASSYFEKNILVIDTDSGSVIATIPTPSAPEIFKVIPNTNKVIVSFYDYSKVWIVDLDTLETSKRFWFREPIYNIFFSHNGQKAYLYTSQKVCVYDLNSLEHEWDILLDAPLVSFATSCQNKELYLGCSDYTVSILDTDSFETKKTLYLNSEPTAMKYFSHNPKKICPHKIRKEKLKAIKKEAQKFMSLHGVKGI